MFEPDVPLPPHVQVAGLVKDPTGGPVLRRIYESYVDAAPFQLVADAFMIGSRREVEAFEA